MRCSALRIHRIYYTVKPLFDYAELTLLISYALVLITPTYLSIYLPIYILLYHISRERRHHQHRIIGTRAYTLPFCQLVVTLYPDISCFFFATTVRLLHSSGSLSDLSASPHPLAYYFHPAAPPSARPRGV